MSRWPKDTQAARNAFYGDPAKGEIAPQMVPVVPPFKLYYGGKPVKAIQFHKRAAPALAAALQEIWDACAHDQKKIDALGISKYAGAYNHRKVRGSATKWSNHAYAAAIDLNAEDNGLYQKGNMPQLVIDAFCRQGAMWGGWYKGRLDPMHFEFVDNGGRQPSSKPPIWPPRRSEAVEKPEQDAPKDVVGEGVVKTLAKSKIAQASATVGVMGAGDAIDQAVDTAGKVEQIKGSADNVGITDYLVPLAQNPRFWVALAVVLCVGLVIYWRWRDHR